MSETIDTVEAKPGAEIANFAVANGPPMNGSSTTRVTFGEPPRSIEFRKLDLVDQWDIAELAPDPSPRWMGMTLMAASVITIDGSPTRPATTLTRDIIRERLKKIGADGMNAIAAALEAATPEIAETPLPDAVKN